MQADVFDFLPAHIPVPVSYLFLTAQPLSQLEHRHVRASAAYQTSQQLVTPLYKHISRCIPPFSL
jgi:hypothetical protein